MTGVLVLNTSIEAGEDFGVVADESKTLATESQQRAQEIETTVETVQSDSLVEAIETIAAANEAQTAKVTEIQGSIDDLEDPLEAIATK